ncbi:MAG: hypothetical protein JWP38_1461, partial [Herbaspirillum sp.]|nr:hypothetical protein [Herbaspirillum sp.]
MSTFSKNFVRVLGVLLLLLMLTAAPMRDADAAMPRAGQQIGTRATITYRDAMDVAHARQSDVVYTRIAQVYQINIVAMLDTARAGAGEDADIPFQIANIGNGVDDVSVTVKNFPLGVDEVRNTIAVEQNDGDHTRKQELEVSVPGPAASIEITAPRQLIADGKSVVALGVALHDAAGLPASSSNLVTLRTDIGSWITQDANPQE